MRIQPRVWTALATGTVLTALAVLSGCGDDDSSSGSTTATITITAPGIVGPNEESEVVSSQPTLMVTNVTVSGSAATPTYTFQVATDQGFGSIVVQVSGIAQGSGQTSWEVSEPLENGEYFWRARAEAGGTNGPFSAVARFTVGIATRPGETIVVFDPLTDGTTLATGRNGGTLTPEGWRVNTNADFLRYEVPTVVDGYVQWENLGLTPRGANADSHMLFGMWDPTAGAFRQNAFRVNVQKLWNNPHNPPFIRFRFISQGREHDDGHDFTAWDPGIVYTWRVDWGPAAGANTARVFLDGEEIMRVRYNRPYQPNTHWIELGVAERFESVIDAIYRNFVVVRRGQ